MAEAVGLKLVAGVIGSLVGFVALAGIQHLIGKVLGGGATFGQQAYVVGAIIAPLLILTSVVAALPAIAVISPFIALFGLIFDIIALKAMTNFGWIKTLLSSFVIWVFVGVVLSVFGLIGVLSLGLLVSTGAG